MKLNGPGKYSLTIKDRSISVRAPDGTPHFIAPATTINKPKLYVVSKDGALIYVGVTSQSMSARLRSGLTADGAHGYHGYSWGKKDHSLRLDIWYVEGNDMRPNDLETIEAEVVFLHRYQSGQWPEAQTEIHFHSSRKIHRQFAEQILDAVKTK
jgi:hypothetical protein